MPVLGVFAILRPTSALLGLAASRQLKGLRKKEMARFIESIRDGLMRRWRFARSWVRDGTPLWLWLAVAAVMFGLPYLYPVAAFGVAADIPDRVRWSGMLFQFAGLATVVWGLNRSRQLFDRPSLWKAIGQWFARARHFIMPPKPTHLAVNPGIGAATAFGTAAVREKVSGRTLENRVKRLEEEADRLDKKLSETRRNLSELRSETNQRLGRERAERVADNRKISRQLETATIGGIHLEVAELAYLFVGIAMTAVPAEIAWLLQ